MRKRSIPYRLALIFFAILISGVLLREQLSNALVTRGDSLAYFGNRDAAIRMYSRALFYDPGNAVAADRYAFNSWTSTDPQMLAACVRVATQYLARVARDATVLFDRALCYQHQHLLPAAIDDFRRAGEAGADAKAFMFAALDERALHHLREARELLSAAIAADPGFAPARRELLRN